MRYCEYPSFSESFLTMSTTLDGGCLLITMARRKKSPLFWTDDDSFSWTDTGMDTDAKISKGMSTCPLANICGMAFRISCQQEAGLRHSDMFTDGGDHIGQHPPPWRMIAGQIGCQRGNASLRSQCFKLIDVPPVVPAIGKGKREICLYRFGFGALDCGGMVSMATLWTTVPEQLVCEIPADNPEL